MSSFSPSLSLVDVPGGGSRRDLAIERSIDAMHDQFAWTHPRIAPTKPGAYMVKNEIAPRSLTRRVVFTGGVWISDEPVAAWRPIGEKEARAGVSALIDKNAPVPTARARSFDELALEPLDPAASRDAEMATLQRLSTIELRVEVVRFSRPAPDATGVSTGKIMAVSENYSAQRVGADQVVIHENANLSRVPQPGERVTMGYKGGVATVHDGLFHDVNIDAPWMPQEQRSYLRMMMIEALSAIDAPQSDDEKLRAALLYSLESTAKFFGATETRLRAAEIQLAVNEKRSVVEVPESQAPAAPRSRKP